MKNDLALLVLRLGFGGIMLFAHGLPKLTSFSERSQTFADPLGVSPMVSLSLAIFAEVFCSVALIGGFLTRFAAIPLIITMAVAAGIIHADDPWSKKEMAILFGTAFVALALAGPGRFSIDSFRKKAP